MSTPTKVYYIQGRFLPGMPLQDHEVESKAAAEELVATGLYALSAKDANEQAFTTPDGGEATDENVKPTGGDEAGDEAAPGSSAGPKTAGKSEGEGSAPVASDDAGE